MGKTINLTLHLTVTVDDEGDHPTRHDPSIIAETALQGAVDSMPNRDIRGYGYNYSFTTERTRRGMDVRPSIKAGEGAQ